MWRNTTKHLLTIMALAGTATLCVAQPKDNSPLSRIGLGELHDLYFVSAGAQGGLGAAYRRLHEVNLKNPATLGFLEATALEIGMFAKRSAFKRNDFSSKVWSGNLNYLSLSIPLLNPINELLERREREFAWGINVALTPHSTVGYAINSTDVIENVGTVSRSFQGTGGTYRAGVSSGWRYQDLAVGLSAGYLFGNTTYNTETSFDDIILEYITLSRTDISYRGFIWNSGLQYDIRLKPSSGGNRRFITLGAHYTSASSFDTKRDHISVVSNAGLNDRDTSEFALDIPGTGKLPGEFGVGVMVQESNNWSAGIDFSRRPWSVYENTARPDALRDTWRLAGGVAYTPNFSSISSYFSRIEYRAGLYYQKDPRVLEGEQASQYGVTAGMGLPFVFLRTFSYLNIGLEYAHAGTENALRENLLRGRIGIVLNDNQWFLKRRYQ